MDLLEITVTVDEVRNSAQRMIEKLQTADHEQTTYVDSMERPMAFLDEQMDTGQWNMLHTTRNIHSLSAMRRSLRGKGWTTTPCFTVRVFHARTSKWFPPVTPTTCLHILPAVHRNRPTRIPTTQEVNRAQASFSTNYCYGNVNDPALNQFLQPHFRTEQARHQRLFRAPSQLRGHIVRTPHEWRREFRCADLAEQPLGT